MLKNYRKSLYYKQLWTNSTKSSAFSTSPKKSNFLPSKTLSLNPPLLKNKPLKNSDTSLSNPGLEISMSLKSKALKLQSSKNKSKTTHPEIPTKMINNTLI